MSEITKDQEEAITREIDAHDEALKEAIDSGVCLMCTMRLYGVEKLPRAIRFYCSCGWSATYPIRTLGNSERAKQDEALDLIAQAERDVQPLWSSVLDWEEKYEEEKAIVDRVWKALSIETFEQARGFAIDELVAESQRRIEELTKLIVDSQRPHGTCYWGMGYGFTSGMEEACTACEAKRKMKAIAALESREGK